MNDPDSSITSFRNSQGRTKQSGRSAFELFVTLVLTLLLLGLLIAMMMPVTRNARPAARRTQCRNNLKQIALALHNYAEKWKALPPATTVDATGNSLHSWRTLILPYLDEGLLYQSIDLSKPWNDPANVKAYESQVPAYRCPATDGPHTHTTYLAIVAPGGCFHPTKPRKLSEITDGTGETMMIIEVDPEHGVHWMSPVDAEENRVLSIGPKSRLAHLDGVQAAFVDGSVHFISADAPAAERRALISIGGADQRD